MAAPQLGPYASSGALSTQYYKLVQAVEQARTAEDVNSALLACLSKIRTSWSKYAPSPSTARHDLVLVLYCRTQRTHTNDEDLHADELFDAAWALPVAVMLAGGGGRGVMQDREIGYRACAELFSPLKPHPLKLLLINTIRSDLFAPLGSPKAEARWGLALRATATPSLASPELTPAIRERVLELLLHTHYPDPIRRLALEALLSLIRVIQDGDPTESSSLLFEARDAVLSLLLPPPPSSSASTSSRHRSSRQATLPLPFLAALVSSVAPSSPLHPILPERSQRIQLFLQVGQRILAYPEDDARAVRKNGVKRTWALGRALKTMWEELAQSSAAGDALDVLAEESVAALVWDVVGRMLEHASEIGDAVILSALRLLPFLRSVSTTAATTPLRPLLARLHSHLLRPASSNALLFALCALAHLPPATWATSDNNGKTPADSPSLDGEPQWNESAWRAILAGLEHPDSALRRATLALLQRVDPKLVAMQYERLLASHGEACTPAASVRSSSSVASERSTGGRKHAERTIARLLEVLPFLSPSSPAARIPTLPSADALLALLDRPELALSPTTVLPALVVPVLHAFEHAPPVAQRAFARDILLGEKNAWRRSVVAGLWGAGSVHALELGEAEEAAGLLSGWLANADGATSADLLLLLQEPFLFALLRLLALQPSLASSPVLLELAHAPATPVSPETSRLFGLLAHCTSPSMEGHNTFAIFQQVGTRTRSAQLGEFGATLLAAIASPPSPPPVHTAPPPQPHRLHHPTAPPAPLRYSYTHSPASGSAAAVSPAARARERADLLRERSERGGRGAREGEMVESVRTPVMRVGELPDEEEGEGDDGEGESGGDQRELEGEGDGADAVEVEGTSGEPPADLLLEIEALDPFRPG